MFVTVCLRLTYARRMGILVAVAIAALLFSIYLYFPSFSGGTISPSPLHYFTPSLVHLLLDVWNLKWWNSHMRKPVILVGNFEFNFQRT